MIEGDMAWYMNEFQKNLRIRDEVSRNQIVIQVGSMIKRSGRDIETTDDLVRRFGDPADLGRELSNPLNWMIDMGTPMSPGTDIEPFFSGRGRLILSLIFLMALAIPIGIFLVQPDSGWLMPGMLIVFIVLWALGLSFLNTYLGYIGTTSKLMKYQVNVKSIDMSALRRHARIFVVISVVLTVMFGIIPLSLEPGLLTVAVPISVSTILASFIGYRMLNIEGGKVLSDIRKE
ncbi:MAG: hypothetical protein ACMUHY_03665 [Thermoplasmatota archaeon]